MARLTKKELKAKEAYWNEYLKECQEEIKKEKQIKEREGK